MLLDGTTCATSRSRRCAASSASCPRSRSCSAARSATTSSFARPDATDDEVLEACRLVGLGDLIDRLPDGLDTPVHERGVSLSSGERQLLALARAFLARPRVLVLDEATSNLDLRSEAQIEHALDVLLEGRTAILIAHRLATAMRADRIAVVDDGRIVELGTHDELLGAGGSLRRHGRHLAGPRMTPRVAGVDGARLRRRLMRRSATVSILASLVGAAMAYAYLTSAVAERRVRDCDSGLGEEILVVSAYFVVAVIVTDRLARLAYRGMRWLDEEPATDRPRAALDLAAPGRLALLVLLAWLVAARPRHRGCSAIGGADGRSLARSATTIALVGLLIATFMAFSLERLGRPVFARALEGDDVVLPSRWLGLRPRLLLGWLVSSAVPFMSLLLLPFTTGERGPRGRRRHDLRALAARPRRRLRHHGGRRRGITAPLTDVRRALKHVGEGDLDVRVDVDASGELGQVQQGVNAMVAGLRDRRRIETILGHHVGEEVAQLAVAGEPLGSEQREASVLFVDVIGSTEMAERLPPDEVVGRLNDLFAAVVRVVRAEGGLVNKFDGDGALCVFGAPTPQPDHATRALRAARALRAEIEELGRAPSGLRRRHRRGVRARGGGSGRRRRALRVHRAGRAGERRLPAHRPGQGPPLAACWRPPPP